MVYKKIGKLTGKEYHVFCSLDKYLKRKNKYNCHNIYIIPADAILK